MKLEIEISEVTVRKRLPMTLKLL